MPDPSEPERPTRPDSLPAGVELAPGVRVPPRSIRVTFVRSSGPGGQNVNKRSTKARLRVALADIPLRDAQRARLVRLAGSLVTDAGEIVIQDDATRSTERNKQACMDRLRALVAQSLVVPKKRRPTKPTKGSVERRLDQKKQRAQTKSRRRKMDD